MNSAKYCTKCKKIIYDDSYICPNCKSELLNVEFNIVGSEQDYKHVKSEEDAAMIIIDNLGIDKSLFEYVKPCEDYSTIRYKGFDFIRIKYTDNSKWIQIPMTTKMRNANMDNPLFEEEKNKNKVFWKSKIRSLLDYKELLLEVISFRDNESKKNN